MARSVALISTTDLVAMDRTALEPPLAALHLDPQAHGYGSSSPRAAYQRYPAYGGGAPSLAPTAEAGLSSPRGYSPQLQLAAYGASPRPGPSRLAPDRYGHEIPMDAQWTKIRRALVSPEVLERAGVRYEARPDYVAVLGRLSREQVADFARQSAECRAARSGRYLPRTRHDRYQRERSTGSRSSRDDDESESCSESDTTDYQDDGASEASGHGARSRPFIVSPPAKDRASPASTVMPKPILKNRNANHVRFDPEPHEIAPRSPPRDDRARFRSDQPRRHRDHGRDRERSGRSRDRRDGHRRDGDSHRRGDRNRRGDGRDERRDDRAAKKNNWGEAFGAVGIGGAAASLLGALAEAAVGM